jgi:ribose-phosphate pyrophosphokinase
MVAHNVIILSTSPIKVGVCTAMADFMSAKEGVTYSVVSAKVEGGRDGAGNLVNQPFDDTTYTASKSRIDEYLKTHELVASEDLIVSFENGIQTQGSIFDFCVMTVRLGGDTRQYTSFGIEIDPTLFTEYVSQMGTLIQTAGTETTFGEFIASKMKGVKSNNWMKDIRFGNTDRTLQLQSCVDRFYIDHYARYVPDFPRPGVLFKDITPIMVDPTLLGIVNSQLVWIVTNNFPDIDYIAGLDSRGFYFAPVLAQMLGKGFIPIRKALKLPVTESDRNDRTKIVVESYSTEYSEDQFGLIPEEVYIGKRVLILDDLLATGGSIEAATNVLANAGMAVAGALTVYDVRGLRDMAYEKLSKIDGLRMMTLVQPDICVGEATYKYRCVCHDTKDVSYPMTDMMIQRFREPPHLDADEIENNQSIYDSTMSDDSVLFGPKLSRRYTLSTREWIGGLSVPVKLDRVRVLYTEKDADLAHRIIEVLAIDQEGWVGANAVEKFGVKIKAGLFPNGESHAFIQENIRNCHVFIVSRIRTGHINDDLMELYLIMDACNRSGVDKKTVIMPYYPYSRSDKKDAPRTHIGAAVQASFLADLKIDNLVSIDLHAGQIQGLVSRGFHNLYLQNYLAEYIYTNYLRYYPESEWNKKFVLIAPDAGSTKAIKSYSNIFKIDNIALDKSRNYKAAEDGKSAVNKVRFIGDREDFEGKVGLIIDDMGDTMGTMSAAVDTLVENGLDSAIVFVTHGVLSGPAMERINSNPHIKEVVVSDSLPQAENKKLSPKLRVVSTAELLGRTIDGILTGRSISRLFD